MIFFCLIFYKFTAKPTVKPQRPISSRPSQIKPPTLSQRPKSSIPSHRVPKKDLHQKLPAPISSSKRPISAKTERPKASLPRPKSSLNSTTRPQSTTKVETSKNKTISSKVDSARWSRLATPKHVVQKKKDIRKTTNSGYGLIFFASLKLTFQTNKK